MDVIQPPTTRKRKRPSLVCSTCKRKKIKCDRELPCSNCVKSKCASTCAYDDGVDSQTQKQEPYKNEFAPYESSAKNPIQFDRSHDDKRMKSNNVTISLSELNMLKERLQNIESSINNSKKNEVVDQMRMQYPKTSNVLPPPIMSPWSSPKPHTSSIGSQSSLSTSHALSDARDIKPPTSIQLPPIHFRQPYSDPSSSISSNTYRSSISNTTPNTGSYDSDQNLIGFNPYLNEEDSINFYEGYTSSHVRGYSRVNYGPLAWGSLMQKDRVLKLLWQNISKQKQQNGTSLHNYALCQSHEINQENTQIVVSEANESETSFKKKALEVDGYSDVVPYHLLKEKMKKNINQEGKNLGLTLYDGQINMELQLIDKIHQILPRRKVIWKLIDRFFSTLYPFMPFIDEEDFNNSVIKIIGPKSYKDETIKEIKVEKRLDLATIGLLLIVLRLSYLSLFRNKQSVNEERLNSTDPSEEAQDMKYLLQNSISINIVQYATCCFLQFDILRKSSFPVLQLALFLLFYHMFAPEDGDDGDGSDSHVLKSVVFQMAYSIGLNREPDNFKDIVSNKRENHLFRKMWYLFILNDIHNAYTYGTQTLIDENSYDTKLPFHEEGNENLIDKRLDKFVTESFFNPTHFKLYFIIADILKLVLNVRGRTKLSQLCGLTSKFEIAIQDKFGSLNECMQYKSTSEYGYQQYFPVKFYISLKSFLVSLYFHIFLHYETRDTQLSFIYMKKILNIAAGDIMPHYFEILGSSEITCDMVINPKLIQIIHKLNQICIALTLRVNYTIYSMKNQSGHDQRCNYDPIYLKYYKELCKFSSCLTRCAEVSIAAVSKLSTRYYSAWKITKGHTFLLKTITTMSFYEQTFDAKDSKLRLPSFTAEQIEEVVLMCECALRKLGKMSLVGNEFCKEAKCQYQNTSMSSSDTNSTPGTDTSSTDARLRTNDFGLDLVNNEEVDKLWLQILSMKNDQQPQQLNPSNMNNFQSPLFQDQFPIGTPRNLDIPMTPNFGLGSQGKALDMGDNYDFFADLPFDQMFNGVNI